MHHWVLIAHVVLPHSGTANFLVCTCVTNFFDHFRLRMHADFGTNSHILSIIVGPLAHHQKSQLSWPQLSGDQKRPFWHFVGWGGVGCAGGSLHNISDLHVDHNSYLGRCRRCAFWGSQPSGHRIPQMGEPQK